MQAVGRLGSYISKSVYTVSGPFHPFGGAVDIIVVEQPDGTYKSSPWYVRFGKFQGVLKTKEKVVSISVNGSEANFHMYLNHKGEAYFLQEDDEEEHDGDPMCSPPSSSGEDTERSTNGRLLGTINRNESCVIVRENSLERAQIAADLLDLKWSTNLDSPRIKNDNIINNTNKIVAGDEVDRHLPVEDSLIGEENRIEMECVTEKYVISATTSAEGLGEMQVHDSIEKDKGNPQFTLIHEKRVSITEYSQSILIHKSNEKFVSRDDAISECGSLEGPLLESQISNFDNREPTISNEEQLVFGNLDDFRSVDSKVDSLREAKCLSLDRAVIDDYINDGDQQWIGLRPVSSESCIEENGNVHPKILKRLVRSLPIAGPLGDMLEASDECQPTFESVVIVQDREEGHANVPTDTTPRPIDSLDGNQRSWPFMFKRSKSMKSIRVETETVENYNPAASLTSPANLEVKKDVTIVKERKRKFVRTLTPTSQQLASINLKEGKNIVVFTFQTAMLGKQQVDARIFIWRWDTRIVISDVDGTITRSDLLGQVMPLVGMDWSQTGVAHLFSAIKENGYQLLFLSARSIAQSFLTRQFLSNIRQDGKALPDGPVVISPDGLFPSLFREVIRRAPHEFKISCLEDIKALFPADTNPFYAGFGNRHTDEFSYLKVGIPRGKIFIINPKGEIVVNRRVDTKSYVSLHAIVHGMFPTMSSYEQEDFNSWNYWKLPPPAIDS